MRLAVNIFVFAAILAVYTTIYAQQPATDSSFKPSGKFTSLVFGDYSYKVHADSANRGVGQYSGVPKAFSNFQIRRLYLGYNYDISQTFRADVLLAYEDGGGTSATLDGSGERSFYLKLANIRWKDIFSGSDLIFGAQATPAFVPLTEQVWGYRAIEKTIIDKNKLGAATDLGLGLQGSLDHEKNYGYDILFGNGSGQKLETDKFKKLYADLWGKFFEKVFVVNLYGDLNRSSDFPSKDVMTGKLFLAYQTKKLTIAVEGFIQSQSHSVIDSNYSSGKIDTLSLSPFGLSIYVTGMIVENSLGFFARYDMFNPDNNYLSTEVQYQKAYNTTNENFVVAGLDWQPAQNVHVMPNIWYTAYSNKKEGVSGNLKSDYDLAPRLTIFYKF